MFKNSMAQEYRTAMSDKSRHTVSNEKPTQKLPFPG